MEKEKFKLDEIQDTIESYIMHISETYNDHGKCGLLIRSLRSAADDIHTIRFDLAVSSKMKIEQKKENETGE